MIAPYEGVHKTWTPSPQQQVVFEWVVNGSGNLVLIAVAGSGKTTTILKVVEIINRINPTAQVAFAAYNNKIGKEIEFKVSAAKANATVKTFHAFCFGVLRRAFPAIRNADPKKNYLLCDELRVPRVFHGFVNKAVSIAKQRGLGVLVPNDHGEWMELVDHFDLDQELADDKMGMDAQDALERGLEYAQAVLARGIEVADRVIDFDDMIYMALLRNCRFPQYDWLLVDEAQDTNPTRREVARRMLKRGGRAIFVGDPGQAIYGFTGADNDSLELIMRDFQAIELPLSVSFRCPKDVVWLAQSWCSHIQSAEHAPDGVLCNFADVDFTAAIHGKRNFCPSCYSVYEGVVCEDCGGSLVAKLQLRADDAILCRNTKPLVEYAFALIRAGIPCHVEGREIGRGLLSLVNKWKISDMDTLREKLEDYAEKECKKLIEKGREVSADYLTDKVETIYVIMDALPPGSDVAGLRAKIESMFSDTVDGRPAQNLTLCTVHKSKGLEWNRVFLLGRNKFMPSRFARQEWQMKQETNLMYVAVTRAKQELIEITVTK